MIGIIYFLNRLLKRPIDSIGQAHLLNNQSSKRDRY